MHQIAIEGQEVGGELLTESVAQALSQVDVLVVKLQRALQVNRTQNRPETKRLRQGGGKGGQCEVCPP